MFMLSPYCLVSDVFRWTCMYWGFEWLSTYDYFTYCKVFGCTMYVLVISISLQHMNAM